MKKYYRHEWIGLIIGILLILLGLFTFIRPGSVLTGIVIVYGVIAVITGIGDIIQYIKVERYTGFGLIISLISGILSVMCGIMLLTYPDAGAWILTLLFPIWFISHCISRLMNLNLQRMFIGASAWYFSMSVNIIGIILGFLMILHPMLAFMNMRIVGYVSGVYFILMGIESVIMSFRKKIE